MKYFEKYFSDVDFVGKSGDVKVHCPFHNDTNPSASVNVDKDTFFCYVCGVGFNEAQFIAKINNIELADAFNILSKFQENQTRADWHLTEKAHLWANLEFLEKVRELGITDEIIEQLDLGITKDDLGRLYLGIPTFYNGVLMDIRSYNLLKHQNAPKCSSLPNANTGFIIPYDLWRTSDEKTYIFEGEKDMLLARSLGLNAITLTGGASSKPNKYVIDAFKGKDFVICYDNDTAGNEGSEKLFGQISKLAKSVKYIKIGEIVKENKEDFYDAVVKYGMDIYTFLSLKEYDFTEIKYKKQYIKIRQALNKNLFRKNLLSKVMISAEFEDTFAVPTYVTLKKVEETGKKDTLFAGEERTWVIGSHNIQQFLELIEADAKKQQVINKIKSFVGIPSDEKGIEVKINDYATLYKTKVIDVDDLSTEDIKRVSLDLYAYTGTTVGKQYEIDYKLFPHPTKQQKLVAIATNVVCVEDSNDFKVNKDLLSSGQTKGTIKERVEKLYQSAKHHIAKHLSFKIWLMSDLVMNSILEFNYGTLIRGALDVFILGDTQIGKSETVSKLIDLYNYGHLISLKTSTTVGLIGGSNKVDGSWLNTIGAIPRQHKKFVALEEFSGARQDFIKTMTHVRSSGRLKLARAAGEIDVPCLLRMITLSNPLNDDKGNPRHLSTFPNGIIPLMELIKSAEDVARYDGFLLVAKPKERFNPFSYKLEGEPLPKEFYEHKAQWVLTRTKDDVVFEEGVDSYIWEKAEELNKLFECNFPLFTTTSSLKLSRFSVALASLLLSVNETFEKVVVTKEIVDYVSDFLVEIYDNDVFKLREYKDEYDSYNRITKAEVAEIQKIFNRHSTLFEFLEHQSSTSRGNLRSVSGLDGDDFNPVFNKLVKYKLLTLSGETVYPTEKFRMAMKRINKFINLDAQDTFLGEGRGKK